MHDDVRAGLGNGDLHIRAQRCVDVLGIEQPREDLPDERYVCRDRGDGHRYPGLGERAEFRAGSCHREPQADHVSFALIGLPLILALAPSVKPRRFSD